MSVSSDLIKAEVHMISGCRDAQESADVKNVDAFDLPDAVGRSGGACTSALLKVLYDNHEAPTEQLSFRDVLLRMREVLKEESFSQIPQLTSSKLLNVNSPFDLLPDYAASCTKRALLIGINYVGQGHGELSGCHNDVLNIKNYLVDVQGVAEDNITILMDDGEHLEPNYDHILNGYDKLVSESEPGDSVFCHFSGHGSRIYDESGDEADNYDETLIPVDFQISGQIKDDLLYRRLVGAMPEGVILTCLFDCCHSGTVLDLPYKFVANGENEEMAIAEKAEEKYASCEIM